VKIKLKFIVLYISPARPGTILSVVREITCIKKNIKKHIILESIQECAKDLFCLGGKK
jgi:hypothetical protein